MDTGSGWRRIGASLELKYQQYVAGLEASGQATKKFAGDMALAATGAKDFDSATKKLDQVGSKMTRNITLPVAGAAFAVDRLATRFNTTFTQMTSLAGVPAAALAKLKDQTLGLAHDTGRGPQELAEALYQIESSGVDSSKALDILKVSAEGSAIGLGETAAVADALTSAINTYGAENLSAAQAADTLTQAVADGKGEAASFAPQLGRLLPLANNLGVSFGNLSGAFAYLSQTSPVDQSATQLLGVLSKLLKPSQQGAELLTKYGLSADKLRATVAEKGLLPALQMLSDKFDGNQQSITRFFDDVEGLQGFYNLVRNGGTQAAAVIDDVTNSAGRLSTAFKNLQGTDEFKQRQALADLQVEGVRLGQILIPIVADLGGDLVKLAQVFEQLPEPVQKGTVAFIGMAAAAGPLLKIGAGVANAGKGIAGFARGVKGVASEADGAAGSLGKFVGSLGGAGLATGGLALLGIGAIFYGIEQNAAHAAQRARELQAGIDGILAEMKTTGDSAKDVFTNITLPDFFAKYGPGLDKLGVTATKLRDKITGPKAEFEAFGRELTGKDISINDAVLLQHLHDLRSQFTGARRSAADQKAAEAELGVQNDKTAGSTQELADATKDLGIESDGTTGSLTDLDAAARKGFDAGQALTTAHRTLSDALTELSEKQEAAKGNSDQMRRARQGEADAERGLAAAQRDSRSAQLSLSDARDAAARSLRDMALSAEGARLGEQGAKLGLLEAQDALDNINPDATDLERAQAALRVQQANLAMRQAVNSNADTQTDNARAQAKGVEGSDQVIAAKQRVIDTAQAEKDAEQRVGEASRAVSDLRIQAAKDVQSATEKVHEAQLGEVDATGALATVTFGASAGHDALLRGLNAMRDTLAPDNPLRVRLDAYILALSTAVEKTKELGLIGPIIDPKTTGTIGLSGGSAPIGGTTTQATNPKRPLPKGPKHANLRAPDAPLISHVQGTAPSSGSASSGEGETSTGGPTTIVVTHDATPFMRDYVFGDH